MSDWSRVATFEADDASIDAVVQEINSADGPPPGVAGTRITVLADRSAGKLVIAVRFGSEADLQAGEKVFAAMQPPDSGSMRRVSVDHYEVLLERDA